MTGDDPVADGYDDHHGGTERAVAAARAVASLLDPARGRVLDLGVGPGTVACHLPGRVVGVDPDAERLGSARRRLPVVRADGAAMPFGDADGHPVLGFRR